MNGMLEGKVIIVTGAGGGIGKAAAEVCAREGASVVVAGRTKASVDAVCAAIVAEGGQAVAIVADVSQGSDAKAMVDLAQSRFGRLDGAFNNAGIDGPLVPAADYPEDAFDEVLAINLKGVWNCMRFQIPAMLAAGGGAIVNNASGLSQVGQFGMVAYCASKAGVLGLTRAAALDYGAQGIRINALSPGVIETPMMQSQMTHYPDLRAMLVGRHPIGRLGQVEEIANAAAWMLSDKASFMLGANVSVDGGFTRFEPHTNGQKGLSMNDLTQKIEQLWVQNEIEQVLLRFGRALDRGDWALYRSCLADRIRVDFERLTGSPEIEVDADDWTRFAELALSPVRRHHQYSNFAATIDGDRATATLYMVARHWRPSDRGDSMNTQYGWYDNQLSHINGQWKITRLSHQFQWIEGNDGVLDFSAPELVAHMAKVFSPANHVTQSGPTVAP